MDRNVYVRTPYKADWHLNKVCSTHTGEGDVPNLTLKPNRRGEVHLMTFSDVHFGANSFNRELFLRHIELARSLNAYIILGGDLMEVALPSRIEESVWEQDFPTGTQYRMARDSFGPLRDRILFSNTGNHDARVWKKTGFDLAERLAEDFGCFYNNHGGYLILNVGEQQYHTAVFHGFSAGINPFHELEKRLVTYDQADILFMGNNHVLDAKRVVKKRVKNGNEERHVVWLVRTGSFITEPDYGRAALYAPTLDGCPVTTLKADSRNIDVDVRGETRWL